MNIEKAKMYVDKINEIMDFLNRDINDTYCYDDLIERMEDEMDDNGNFIFSSFNTNSGATKIAIVFNMEDFVLKLPICGDVESEYWNENTDEYDLEEYWYGYEGVSYCEDEYLAYETMVDAGYGKYFPETIFYKNVLIQEKVNPADEAGKNNFKLESKKSSETAYRITCDDNFCCIDESWLAVCVDRYGELDVLKFLDYASGERSGFVDDWVDKNLGFKLNHGEPCVLDFCGFYN
jgi:hypothetical protein